MRKSIGERLYYTHVTAPISRIIATLPILVRLSQGLRLELAGVRKFPMVVDRVYLSLFRTSLISTDDGWGSSLSGITVWDVPWSDVSSCLR